MATKKKLTEAECTGLVENVVREVEKVQKIEERRFFSEFMKMRSRHQASFAVLILVGVVAVWRGVWGLMDEYLFTDNLTLSYIVSIIIGLGILGATHYVVKELT